MTKAQPELPGTREYYPVIINNIGQYFPSTLISPANRPVLHRMKLEPRPRVSGHDHVVQRAACRRSPTDSCMSYSKVTRISHWPVNRDSRCVFHPCCTVFWSLSELTQVRTRITHPLKWVWAALSHLLFQRWPRLAYVGCSCCAACTAG